MKVCVNSVLQGTWLILSISARKLQPSPVLLIIAINAIQLQIHAQHVILAILSTHQINVQKMPVLSPIVLLALMHQLALPVCKAITFKEMPAY